MTSPLNHRLSGRYRRLLVGALAIGSIATTGPLFAQSEEGESIEEITITGSRLERTGFDTPSPVTVVGIEQIASNSSPALGDLLNQLPQLRTTFGLNNSSRFIGTAGIGQLDLRGLGAARTLVLVNGRRHVSASDGSQSVDVNSIPQDMIERVEIITGANSAVYGADAVAGVVNFILKDDFEGASLRLSGGDAADSDFGRSSVALTLGQNFAEGRGNAIFGLGYESQDLLTAGERGGIFTQSIGEVPNPEDGDTIDANGFQIDDGIPDNIFVPNQGFWAISNAGTSLGLNGQLANDGSFVPLDQGSFEFSNGLQCGGANCPFLDLDTFQVLQAKFERYTLDANLTYDVTDNVEWYLESKYSNVEARQQGQPSFDFGAPVIVQRDNPFVTPSLAAAMDAAGVTSTDLRRFNVDLGLRQERNTRETFRVVSGLRGDIGESGFSYDVFANFGRTTIERLNFNNRIDERWAAAQDAVALDAAGAQAFRDAGINPNAQAGDIVCRSTLQEAQGEDSGFSELGYVGCVPVNVIGFNQMSQASRDFVNTTAQSSTELRQTQISGVLSNPELVTGWAGPIGGVVGFEYREEQSNTQGDTFSQIVPTFFNALADTNGEFDVTEFFAEVGVPLLNDVPFAKDLSLEAAVRASDYSTIGSATTWEARLNWQPFEDLRFRASTGEALRAPTIDDLFAPAGESFANINDPCDFENINEGRNGRNVRIANCQALGIADPENFDSLDEESVTLLAGGNPAIGEEDAETLTWGFVYEPSQIDGLQISVDFWDIKITNAIANTGVQAILDRCVDDPGGINNQFCSLVTRDNIGNITLVNQFPLNLNTLETNGVDFEIGYVTDVGFATLQNRLVGSYLDRRTFFLDSDDDVDDVEGELGDPRLQLNYRGQLNFENWSTFLQLRWIDEQFREEQELLLGSTTNRDPNPDVSSITTLDDILYVDFGATYNFDFGLDVSVLIDNVTDEDPPVPVFGNGGASGIYDNIGRF
ncbi:MAG: TonB-dependent receptor, partial [Pseudomonadota bacterium]